MAIGDVGMRPSREGSQCMVLHILRKPIVVFIVCAEFMMCQCNYEDCDLPGVAWLLARVTHNIHVERESFVHDCEMFPHLELTCHIFL